MPQFVRHLGIYVKGYHATRITRYPNSVATFNQDRLATSGDISLNPGPDQIVSDNGKKPVWKFPCAVCDKPVRCNQKGILCNGCDSWHHIKCIDMDVETYVALSYSQDQWFCKANNCNWPFDFSNLFFESSFSSDTVQISTPAHHDSSVIPTLRHNDQLENQRNICNDILLCHLNINSIQNKFEELVALIRKLKIHIIFISKTKIDSTYPDSQFAIPGYTLYRNDRKKGGGGILVYISTLLPCRRLKITRTYKTLESLPVEIRLGTFEMIIIDIYCPPKSVSGDYQLQLEGELNGICTWASLRRNFVTVIGDINLDRLRPDKSEGKLLLDLEVEQELTCLIDKPTRMEKKSLSHTSTL